MWSLLTGLGIWLYFSTGQYLSVEKSTESMASCRHWPCLSRPLEYENEHGGGHGGAGGWAEGHDGRVAYLVCTSFPAEAVPWDDDDTSGKDIARDVARTMITRVLEPNNRNVGHMLLGSMATACGFMDVSGA